MYFVVKNHKSTEEIRSNTYVFGGGDLEGIMHLAGLLWGLFNWNSSLFRRRRSHENLWLSGGGLGLQPGGSRGKNVPGHCHTLRLYEQVGSAE